MGDSVFDLNNTKDRSLIFLKTLHNFFDASPVFTLYLQRAFYTP